MIYRTSATLAMRSMPLIWRKQPQSKKAPAGNVNLCISLLSEARPRLRRREPTSERLLVVVQGSRRLSWPAFWNHPAQGATPIRRRDFQSAVRPDFFIEGFWLTQSGCAGENRTLDEKLMRLPNYHCSTAQLKLNSSCDNLVEVVDYIVLVLVSYYSVASRLPLGKKP